MKAGSDTVQVTSLTWNEAVLSFSVSGLHHLTVESIRPEKKVLGNTVEADSVGRVRLGSLRPGTDYTIVVRWARKKRTLRFATLPQPRGKLLASFAVVADPHISDRRENRKGRLFVESASLLRDIVEDCNSAAVDAVLIAGDVTNNGTASEYRAARRIMEELECPCLSVPGDHDVGRSRNTNWRRFFGPMEWATNIKGYRAIGLNTSAGRLGKRGREWLEANLPGCDKTVILLSHLQLLADPYIRLGGKRKLIADAGDDASFAVELAKRPLIIYVGHQNIPSSVTAGKAIQVSVPQPPQYPCGYYIVRVYKNGFYHTFAPVRSEILREYSRRASNLAAELYGEAQWCDDYRTGDNATGGFVWKYR